MGGGQVARHQRQQAAVRTAQHRSVGVRERGGGQEPGDVQSHGPGPGRQEQGVVRHRPGVGPAPAVPHQSGGHGFHSAATGPGGDAQASGKRAGFVRKTS